MQSTIIKIIQLKVINGIENLSCLKIHTNKIFIFESLRMFIVKYYSIKSKIILWICFLILKNNNNKIMSQKFCQDLWDRRR